MSADSETILRFAHAIARPGARALIIDKDNQSGGWMSIDGAVRSGQALAVSCRPEILALDADGSEIGALLEHCGVCMTKLAGLSPVLVASGRPGHRHLFVRIVDARIRADFEEWARNHGIDVRKDQKLIRPPLAPHRQGLPVKLLLPEDASEALRRLALNEQPISEARPRRLPDRTFRLLLYGDAQGRYKSRSELVQAIVQGAVNAGFGFDYIFDKLMDPSNIGGAKVREIATSKDRRAAHRYVTQSHQKALAMQTQSFKGAMEALGEIRALRNFATSLSWQDRTGPTDRAVILGHLQIAELRKCLTYQAGVRNIAIHAGLSSLGAVSRAQKRLMQAGWLRSDSIGRYDTASTWTIVKRRTEKNNTSHTPSCRSDCSSSCAGSNSRLSPAEFSDIWRPVGFGLRCGQIFELIDGKSCKEVAELIGLSVRAVQVHVNKLKGHRLIILDADGKFRRTGRSLEEVAKDIGVAGEAERQRAKYHREREEYRDRFPRRGVPKRIPDARYRYEGPTGRPPQ